MSKHFYPFNRKHDQAQTHKQQSEYFLQPNQADAPKTFQQIAVRHNSKISNDQQSQCSFGWLISQGIAHTKPTTIKQPLIKKSNSQFLNFPFQNNLGKKTPILKEKKQNLHFKTILLNKKQTQTSRKRPQIAPPSFLKNTKSFIHPQHSNNTIKQDWFIGGLQQMYHGSQCNSINSLSDRNSEDFDISLNRSFLDSERDQSFIENDQIYKKDQQNQLNCRNSTELTKQLNNINQKIQGILNVSLKSGKRSIHQSKNNNKQVLRATYSTNLLMPPQIELSNSRDNISQKSFMQNPTLSSINFSKKFQPFKKSTIFKSIVEKTFAIKDFDLIEEIGQGKYGKVYMAKHKQSGFMCAIKCVSKAMIREENIELPFVREIKIQMYLNHPNIVKLYGFFSDHDNVYLIMEYCSGGHLLKLIKTKSTFEESQILQVLTNLFQAVSYLHCHGIIHRDLKPQNIVIQNGIYKLCDFGWAAYARGQARTTFCGTPLYVSPEVLKGNQYDAKTDVWGLGVITYELAFGRVPFPIWNQSDMRKIVSDPVYFPNWANVSDKMLNLMKSMLLKNPDDRHSINQILNNGIIKQYLGYQRSVKSEIDSLF